MRDRRVAHVAIDGERVIERHVLRPVDRLHGRIEIVGRMDGHFEDGPKDADRGAQPEVGAVESREIAVKAHAAAARFDIDGVELAQLVREDVFESAGTGCEKLH